MSRHTRSSIPSNPLARAAGLARQLGLAAALALGALPAAQAAGVPVGTVITGSVSGATSGLLGLDSGFTPGPGSNITALSAADLEFLTDDFAVGIDFFSDGLVTVYDNGGTGLIAGSYTLSFDFAAPAGRLHRLHAGRRQRPERRHGQCQPCRRRHRPHRAARCCLQRALRFVHGATEHSHGARAGFAGAGRCCPGAGRPGQRPFTRWRARGPGMKRPSFARAGGAICALALGLSAWACHAAPDVALNTAPTDGWAAQAGGTVGGAAATPNRIYTVANRAQLLAAFSDGGQAPKIVKVVGTIDMSEGVPFTSRADQTLRAAVRVPSNTTLIGEKAGAGFINGHVLITGVTQVIVRNLKIVAPCDVAPVWDPTDGALGNWNAAFDAISIAGADHVWIDHNTITDVPFTDDLLPIENGRPKQCHDGALDITNGADYVTVSYNVFDKHDKAILVGSSDSATGDAGRLRVTFSNNVFTDITQRSPRVRFGQVHLFNNYHQGRKAAPVYAHSYSVGVGRAAQIRSNNNVYAVTGAQGCDSVVTTLSADASSGFIDTGSTLNGLPLGACSAPGNVGWTPPYAFTPRPLALVKANTLAQAGAGKLVTTISGSGNVGGVPGTLVPAKGEAMAYTDTSLSIAFDAAPVIGSSGKVTIRRVSDGVVVDTLDISNAPSATDTQTALPRTNLEIDAIGLGAMPENPAQRATSGTGPSPCRATWRPSSRATTSWLSAPHIQSPSTPAC